MDLLARFLKYVKYDTQSQEGTNQYPSTSKQFELLKELKTELQEYSVQTTLSDTGVLYGFLPSNCNSKEYIGFIAHIDTSPEASGFNVKPNIINKYDGSIIILNNGIKIDPVDFPRLKDQIGHTIITTDGNTLLGADDKAGVAEIMNMIDYIIVNNIPHHNICIAFTPDEEIGCGTDNFDLKLFKANYAYTVDGGKYDEFSYECFNAASAHIEITGVGIHPGEAKNKMVNSLRIATEFDTSLDQNMRPEYTEKYEGFNHLICIKGDEVFTTLDYIIRNHDKDLLEKQKNEFTSLVNSLQIKYPKALIKLTIKDSYSNMKYDLINHMDVINKALGAMKKEGIEPIIEPIRGGTDGARLTSLGLPCPNMPTGGYNYHGVREYADYNEMQMCSKYLINIAKAE